MAFYLKDMAGNYLKEDTREYTMPTSHPPIVDSRDKALPFKDKSYANYVRRAHLERGKVFRLVKTYWFFGTKEKIIQ